MTPAYMSQSPALAWCCPLHKALRPEPPTPSSDPGWSQEQLPVPSWCWDLGLCPPGGWGSWGLWLHTRKREGISSWPQTAAFLHTRDPNQPWGAHSHAFLGGPEPRDKCNPQLRTCSQQRTTLASIGALHLPCEIGSSTSSYACAAPGTAPNCSCAL